MTVCHETTKTLCETGTRSAEGTEAYLKQYVEVTRGDPILRLSRVEGQDFAAREGQEGLLCG